MMRSFTISFGLLGLPVLAQAAINGYQGSCINKSLTALTFDDGPFTWSKELVDTLAPKGARASFFVNGYNWGCIYDEANVQALRYAFEKGYVIGSHTWNHYDITTQGTGTLGGQLDLVETALTKILGIKPTLFRPPYGAYNAETLAYLNSRGYTVVGWTVDSGDTTGASVADQISNVNGLVASDILLAHDVKEDTVKTVIPQTISGLISKGLQLASLDACLGVDPYVKVGNYGARDETWTCAGTPAPGADPNVKPSTPDTTPVKAPASDGACGPSNGGFTCNGSPSGPCCSRYGWCGNGPEWCGTGCQKGANGQWGTCT